MERSFHVGFIPTHDPFPYGSLQPWSGDEKVTNSRTFYEVIFNFLQQCQATYQGLQDDGDCKLKALPGLIIPWKNEGAVYISFFSSSLLPATWTVLGARPLDDVTPATVLVPCVRPRLRKDSPVDIVWYSLDTGMAVAYTIHNVLHLLPNPMWWIPSPSSSTPRWLPWSPRHVVNDLVAHEEEEDTVTYGLGDRYLVRERRVSHLADDSMAWSVFPGSGGGELAPTRYFLESSFLWGAQLYALAQMKK